MTNGTGSGGTDTRKIQLETVVDSTGVKVGTEQAKAAVRDMSSSIAAESQKAAGSVAAIGAGAEKSAQSLDRSTRSMISQIQRVRAEVETAQAGGTRADYFERLAKSRGLDQAALGPYLAQLREIEKAQTAVTGSMDRTALSTKQLAFAARGLPAQFTDIWTSLASGQAPLTVLLQQGGQIKDMFGGIVPAARAVGAALLALVNPYTILAAVGGTLLYAFSQGANESRRLRSSLIETGSAAGVTATQLQAMATRMDALGTTQGKATGALETFVRTGRVGAESLERFSLAAINLEQAGGPAIEKTADAFARLARDPLKATLDLNQAMNYLSVSTLEQITALEKAGKTAEAAAVAQQAYARAIEERAPEMLRNLGYVERAWIGIKNASKEAWDQLLNIGRQKSLLEEVAELQGKLNNGANFGLREGSPERQAAQARLDALKQQLYVTQTIAFFDAARAERQAAQVRATEVWNRRAEEFMTKQQRLAQELTRIEAEGIAAGRTRAEIAERQTAAREKYAEKVKEATGFEQEQGKVYATFVNEFIDLTGKAEAASLDLSASQAKLLKMISDPVWQQMPEAWKEQTLQIAYAAVAQEELNAATKEYEKILRDVQAGMDKASTAYARETQQINERTAKLRLETAQLGLTKEAQAELVIALNEVEVQRLEALRNSDLYALASEREQRDIDERIEALKRLAEAQREAGERGAMMELRRDWERFAGQIEQSLTDALVRGFEGGKSVFKSIGDWIINYFRTVVARGVAQAMVGAFASAMSSMASASGGGGGFGGGGGGGAGNLLGSLGSMFGGGGGGGGSMLGGLGGIVGSFGTAFGEGALATIGGWFGAGAGTSSALGASSALFSMGGSGGAAAGAGMGLGAVAPYLLAAYGLYRIISGVGTGRMRGPAWQQWASQTAGGDAWNPYAGVTDNPALGGAGYFNQQLASIFGAVGAAANQFGGTANPNTRYGLYVSQGTEGSGALADARVVGADGRALFGYSNNGSNADVYQRLMSTVPGMVLAGLQDSNLSKPFEEFFNKFSANGLTQEGLDNILQIAGAARQMAEAFKSLGGPFLQLAELSVEARSGILDLTGGLEQFLGKTSSYLQKFYTDEERQALSLASVDKTLSGAGIDTSGLRTTADFRNLVESIDVSTAAGQRQFAALMNSADAFAFGADLLGQTGMSLSQLTAGAPATVGVDLMVTAQVTTNSLLERIEAAIRETGAQTVAAVEAVAVEAGSSGGGGEVVNLYEGTVGGGN